MSEVSKPLRLDHLVCGRLKVGRLGDSTEGWVGTWSMNCTAETESTVWQNEVVVTNSYTPDTSPATTDTPTHTGHTDRVR